MKRLTEEKVMMYDLALEDSYTAQSIRYGLIFERIADRELESETSFIAEEESGRELLKREIRAQALLRLELSARTAEEFKTVTDEWDRLDRNRERRERYHEVSRGDVPLEYDATSYSMRFPRWMNEYRHRLVRSGQYLDLIFDCPYEVHELVTDGYISSIIEKLSDAHKEVLYYLLVREYSTMQLAELRGQSDRNIRKVRATVIKKLRSQLFDHLQHKAKPSMRERAFMERYLNKKGLNMAETEAI